MDSENLLSADSKSVFKLKYIKLKNNKDPHSDINDSFNPECENYSNSIINKCKLKKSYSEIELIPCNNKKYYEEELKNITDFGYIKKSNEETSNEKSVLNL